MPIAARERMSRVDTAWLRMDNDVNLMMIVGVWLLHPKVSYAQLCRRVEDKLLKYERFRQRVSRDAAGATWIEDRDFDIHRHVVRDKLVRGKGQSEREALQARVGELAAQPLDAARPLWQFHLVERYDGGSALIARIHHCIGDGIALISVMMTITDGGGDPPSPQRRAATAAASESEAADWLADAVLKPLGGLSAKAAGVVEASIARALDVLADPQQGLASSIDGARTARQGAGRRRFDGDRWPTTRRRCSRASRAARSASPGASRSPLDQVKAIGKALGCSINDVLLASVSGAIGDWLRDAGRRPDGQGDPRHGAGQPAPARGGLEARQSLRPGAAGAADRHRQSGGAASTPCARAWPH